MADEESNEESPDSSKEEEFQPSRSVRQAKKNARLTQLILKNEKNAFTRRISNILKKATEERTLEEKDLLAQSPELTSRLTKQAVRRLAISQRHLEIEDEEELLEAKCQQLASAIQNSSKVVIYTGAGISTAASIPDYRGPNGVWTLLQKGQVPKAQDLSDAEPTLTHMIITKLYKEGHVKHVVSQNCDGLHLRSGLHRESLSEVHGNMFVEVCSHCRPQKEYIRLFDVTEKTGVRRHGTGRNCHHCGKSLKDTIVHFGEKGGMRSPYRWKEAAKAANNCDVILCLGSSLKILKKYPCLWCMDRKMCKRPDLYIVNLQWTPKDDVATLKINGKCDVVMERVMDILGLDIPDYCRDEDPLFHMCTPLKAAEKNTTSKKILVAPKTIKKTCINRKYSKADNVKSPTPKIGDLSRHLLTKEEHNAFDNSMKQKAGPNGIQKDIIDLTQDDNSSPPPVITTSSSSSNLLPPVNLLSVLNLPPPLLHAGLNGTLPLPSLPPILSPFLPPLDFLTLVALQNKISQSQCQNQVAFQEQRLPDGLQSQQQTLPYEQPKSKPQGHTQRSFQNDGSPVTPHDQPNLHSRVESQEAPHINIPGQNYVGVHGIPPLLSHGIYNSLQGQVTIPNHSQISSQPPCDSCQCKNQASNQGDGKTFCTCSSKSKSYFSSLLPFLPHLGTIPFHPNVPSPSSMTTMPSSFTGMFPHPSCAQPPKVNTHENEVQTVLKDHCYLSKVQMQKLSPKSDSSAKSSNLYFSPKMTRPFSADTLPKHLQTKSSKNGYHIPQCLPHPIPDILTQGGVINKVTNNGASSVNLTGTNILSFSDNKNHSVQRNHITIDHINVKKEPSLRNVSNIKSTAKMDHISENVNISKDVTDVERRLSHSERSQETQSPNECMNEDTEDDDSKPRKRKMKRSVSVPGWFGKGLNLKKKRRF